MRFRLLCALMTLAMPIYAANSLAAETPAPGSLALVPLPKSIQTSAGAMEIGAKSRIVFADDSLMPLAKVLADEIALTTGLQLATASAKPRPGDISLQLDPTFKDEAYSVEVNESAAIKAGNYASLASASATVLQLLHTENGAITLPHVTIADRPAYPYRGALIDLGRKYHTPGGIEQVIELCRLYKIRYLHLHLTDDQLFMFPSTKFPQVGKSNREFARFEPAAKAKVAPYTLEELKALENFARERGVYLVPELDLPGHSGRLIADAHDSFGIPGNGSTVNVASPKTIEALSALLNEVMDVFQSTPYVHLGADEVGLGGLDKTADYKEAQAKFGIKSVHDLYCKFIAEMHAVVTGRGKKAIVWEEAYNAGGAFPLPKEAVVMVWSQGRNPNEIVKKGYWVINATWTPLYIVRDNKRSAEFLFDWELPKFGRENSTKYTTLADTAKLLGTQLCSWENSEAIEIQSLRERLAVVAERAWNPAAGGTFAEFKARLARADGILEKLVHPVSIIAQGKFAGDENTFIEPIAVTLKANQPGLTIKYTLDNSLPCERWQAYSAPLSIEQKVHLRAGLFDAQGAQQGYLSGAWYRSRIPAKPNLATHKPVTVGPAPDRKDAWSARVAVDGRSDDAGGHWASEGAAPQWLQVDLEKVYAIDRINVITYWDGARYYQLTAEVSVDGKQWMQVLDFSANKTPATSRGYSGKFAKTEARYVRINMLKNSANAFVHIVELVVDEAK